MALPRLGRVEQDGFLIREAQAHPGLVDPYDAGITPAEHLDPGAGHETDVGQPLARRLAGACRWARRKRPLKGLR